MRGAELVPGKAFGRVVHARLGQKVPWASVAVLPASSPSYLDSIMEGGDVEDETPFRILVAAVVVERGGVGAHLTCLLRDRGVPVVLLRDARQLLPEGVFVSFVGDGELEVVQ